MKIFLICILLSINTSSYAETKKKSFDDGATVEVVNIQTKTRGSTDIIKIVDEKRGVICYSIRLEANTGGPAISCSKF